MLDSCLAAIKRGLHWYVAVLKKYAIFRGRARRKEFWVYNVFSLTSFLVIVFIEEEIRGIPGLFLCSYILASILPSGAVAVRRLHDTNRSGWWLCLWLGPLLGPSHALCVVC